MRILWIGNVRTLTIPSLKKLSEKADIAMLCPSSEDSEFEREGITFYTIKLQHNDVIQPMTQQVANKYLALISNYKPDIINIQGTENNFGQLQNFISNIPIVISVQGILRGCLPFDNAFIKPEDIRPYTTLKNIIGRGGLLEIHKHWKKGGFSYESDIYIISRYFLCRTNWDKAWVMFSNPNAKIYHCEELLGDPFYENAGTWHYDNCNKHTIFMPSGFNPIKGLHIALKTISLLKKFFPNVKLVVPGLPKHILAYEGLKARIIGEEFVNYCKDIIKKNHIEENVVLLDRLDAEGMAREMKNANVFLSPSTIDNSPNAVGEAMMIGMPIVCTPVGGTTSFMHDEDNCLLSPAGDEFITAYQIKRIFDDHDLASRLGMAAHYTALKRHDKTTTTQQYIEAYEDIIRDFKKNITQ